MNEIPRMKHQDATPMGICVHPQALAPYETASETG